MFRKMKHFSIFPSAEGSDQGLILGENRSSTIRPLLPQIIRIFFKEDTGILAIMLDKTHMALVRMRNYCT